MRLPPLAKLALLLFLGLGLLVLTAWYAARSAALGRLVVYNEGPGEISFVEVRWADSSVRWEGMQAELSRQLKIRARKQGLRLSLLWGSAEISSRLEKLELYPGERLVLRLRSDEGIVTLTRTISWARHLVNWLDGGRDF